MKNNNYEFGVWKQDVLMFLRQMDGRLNVSDDELKVKYEAGWGSYQAALSLK